MRESEKVRLKKTNRNICVHFAVDTNTQTHERQIKDSTNLQIAPNEIKNKLKKKKVKSLHFIFLQKERQQCEPVCLLKDCETFFKLVKCF